MYCKWRNLGMGNVTESLHSCSFYLRQVYHKVLGLSAVTHLLKNVVGSVVIVCASFSWSSPFTSTLLFLPSAESALSHSLSPPSILPSLSSLSLSLSSLHSPFPLLPLTLPPPSILPFLSSHLPCLSLFLLSALSKGLFLHTGS